MGGEVAMSPKRGLGVPLGNVTRSVGPPATPGLMAIAQPAGEGVSTGRGSGVTRFHCL